METKREEKEIDYEVEVTIKRRTIRPPQSRMEEVNEKQIQSKIDYIAKVVSLQLEDHLNGKNTKRLDQPFTINVDDLN